MKKNLSLILALVMLVGSLFSVIPMAEGEAGSSNTEVTEAYVPEIKYANVNYTNKLYMMFAIPAPAALGEGEEVRLLVWNSRLGSNLFSYKDEAKENLEPAEELAVIDGGNYLVFTYDALDATEMSQVICARPVVVKDGAAVSYGKLIEYSVLEYVESAKGNVEGIAAIEDEDVLESLDALLEFGAISQQFSGGDYDFLPSDDVNAIYVTPVVNGFEKSKVLAGFFKYEEGGVASFQAPFYDGTAVAKVFDAEGNRIYDLDEYTAGIQVYAKDQDLEFKVHLQSEAIKRFSAGDFGTNFELNNYDEGYVGEPDLVKVDSYTKSHLDKSAWCNLSGKSGVFDSFGRYNYWHAIKTVKSPIEDDDDGLVFQFTATTNPSLYLGRNAPANKAEDLLNAGFGDTIYPALTIEITLGKVNGKDPETGWFYIQDDASKSKLNIFTLKDGGVNLIDGTCVGEIPETGMRKFAFTIDSLTSQLYAYAENDAGVMERTAVYDIPADTFKGGHENFYSIFTTTPKLLMVWSFGAGVKNDPDFESQSIEINGVNTPIFEGLDGNGAKVFNHDALKAVAERDYSYLVDDFGFMAGMPYEQ